MHCSRSRGIPSRLLLDDALGDSNSSSTTENEIVYQKQVKDVGGNDDAEVDGEAVAEERKEHECNEVKQHRTIDENQSAARQQVLLEDGVGDAHLLCDNFESYNADINLLTSSSRSVPQPPAGVPPIVENSARCRRYKLNEEDVEQLVDCGDGVERPGDRVASVLGDVVGRRSPVGGNK